MTATVISIGSLEWDSPWVSSSVYRGWPDAPTFIVFWQCSCGHKNEGGPLRCQNCGDLVSSRIEALERCGEQRP
jgi:hypothetical protein